MVPFLTFASALAPTHVHEPGPGHQHEHAVAHSHFAPHHLEAHDHRDAGEGPEIEHDDEHVVWIDSPTVGESTYQINVIPFAVPVTAETVPIERQWSVTPFDDAAPLHGPPKPLPSFRGPPLLV
jgi:hypothetical protein